MSFDAATYIKNRQAFPPEGLEKRPLAIHEGFGALGQRAGVWTRNDGGQQVVFVPFYQVQNEQYTTYFTRA